MPIEKLPQMERKRVEELLKHQVLCRIAFSDEEYPYIAPFQYAYLDGSLYFHFTRYGKKINLIKQNNRVAVEIETFEPDLQHYSFVVFRGELQEVTDVEEKIKVLTRMAEVGSERLSANFLAAHGLKKSDGWQALVTEKNLIIMKLTNVIETIALGSPKS
jgi:nitroimidazol reductase NimA-like FMN-containing flavoprotein (pyridoxamine 5'-phosphate oxidase superfamily)